MSFFTLLFPMLLAVGLYALVLWIMYLIIKTAVKNGIRDARMDPASGDWLYRVLRGAGRDALEEHARRQPPAAPQSSGTPGDPPAG